LDDSPAGASGIGATGGSGNCCKEGGGKFAGRHLPGEGRERKQFRELWPTLRSGAIVLKLFTPEFATCRQGKKRFLVGAYRGKEGLAAVAFAITRRFFIGKK